MSIILRQNENLIKTIRRHWVFLAPAYAGWPFLIIALLIVRYLGKFDFFGYWPWVLAISILVVLIILLYKYYIWRFNALVITNQRIVENEQKGFFSKTVTELLFSDILEISYHKEGMSASMYNYGDVKIRTAAENELIVTQIPQPEKVVETINQVRLGLDRNLRAPISNTQ